MSAACCALIYFRNHKITCLSNRGTNLVDAHELALARRRVRLQLAAGLAARAGRRALQHHLPASAQPDSRENRSQSRRRGDAQHTLAEAPRSRPCLPCGAPSLWPSPVRTSRATSSARPTGVAFRPSRPGGGPSSAQRALTCLATSGRTRWSSARSTCLATSGSTCARRAALVAATGLEARGWRRSAGSTGSRELSQSVRSATGEVLAAAGGAPSCFMEAKGEPPTEHEPSRAPGPGRRLAPRPSEPPAPPRAPSGFGGRRPWTA